MYGFEDIERNKANAVAVARRSPKGVDHEQLAPGAVVTFSPNLSTGDRSYTRSIFEVVASAGTQVALKWRGGEKAYVKESIIVLKHEHEFYSAEHLLDAMNKEDAPHG